MRILAFFLLWKEKEIVWFIVASPPTGLFLGGRKLEDAEEIHMYITENTAPTVLQ